MNFPHDCCIENQVLVTIKVEIVVIPFQARIYTQDLSLTIFVSTPKCHSLQISHKRTHLLDSPECNECLQLVHKSRNQLL